MSGSKKRFLYTMLVLTVLSVVTGLLSVDNESEGIVPLFGLDYPIHTLLVNVVWPILGSVVFAFLFPRIFAPFFLALKKYIMPNFKNGQIEVETKPYRLRKWFSRGIYVSLLVLGIQTFLFNIFPYEAMLTSSDLIGFQGAGIDIRFTLGVTGGIVSLLTPVAVGLLSIGWALEDSGLVHYDFPKEPDRIYEIEPIFQRYMSYLKGYAGLSSILFLITIVVYFINIGSTRWIDAIVTVINPLMAMMLFTLGYLVYVKSNTKFLRGRYESVGHVTEDNIKL